MTGLQNIITNRAFTLDELYEFMKEHWDVNEGGEFTRGRPTAASIEEYILLPATKRFMTIVYSRAAGGLFNKENKVVLSTAETPAGAFEGLAQAIPTGNLFVGMAQMGNLGSSEKERKGPAEDVLQRYTEYMRKLLDEAGYLK